MYNNSQWYKSTQAKKYSKQIFVSLVDLEVRSFLLVRIPSTKYISMKSRGCNSGVQVAGFDSCLHLQTHQKRLWFFCVSYYYLLSLWFSGRQLQLYLYLHIFCLTKVRWMVVFLFPTDEYVMCVSNIVIQHPLWCTNNTKKN